MKKILFFDYWSTGIHNFVPLLTPLREAGFDSVLLHLGSWRDPRVPAEEVLQGLTCRDIKYYGGDLKRAFRAESPDVLLGLNFSLMMDRVVRRTCYALGIPTVYLMHGVHPTGDLLQRMAENTDHQWSRWRRLQKVPKYVGITWRYLGSILDSRPADVFSLQPYRYMLRLLTAPGRAIHMPPPAWDLVWDRALVYSNIYRGQFIHQFGFPAEGVIVVGNPELDPAFRLWNSPDCARLCCDYLASTGVPSGQPYVFYVEEALVEQGVLGLTEQDRIGEIREVLEAVNRAGMHLVVKMHPGANPAATLRAFSGQPGITVLCEGDLPKLVWGAIATVAHFSTVCMMPVALGRPIIQPNWSPAFRDLPDGLFTPVCHPVHSPEELQALLRQIASGAVPPHSAEAEQFRQDFISHYDGQAVCRIVESLCQLVGGVAEGVATQRSRQ